MDTNNNVLSVEGSYTSPSYKLQNTGLYLLLVAAAMTMMDFFIVNVALPTIGQEFHTSVGALEWVVAGYGGAYAILLVMGGRLGDIFGRKRILLIGLIGFIVASAICGASPSIVVLVIARVFQGAMAAMLLPQVLATIQAATTGDTRSRAIALYGAVGGLSAALGQVLGGVLVSWNIANMTWRPIFYINVLIGVVLLIGLFTVPQTKLVERVTLDGRGTILFAAAMSGLVIPLIIVPTYGWRWWVWTCLAAAVAVIVLFYYVESHVERNNKTALLPPHLLALRGMRRGLLALAFPTIAFGGFAFAFSVALQHGLGFGALASGLSLLPMALGAVAGAIPSSKIIAKIGISVMVLGGAAQVIGIVLVVVLTYSWGSNLSPWHFVLGMFFVGIGNGLFIPAIYRVVLNGVPEAEAGAGSGILNTTQQAAMTLGVAAVGTLFTTMQARHGDHVGFMAVCLMWIAIDVLVVSFSWLLPDPRSS
jgi:MFS family permease